MKLKKFNLYQLSEGIFQGFYIGCVYATSFRMVGNAAVFMIGEECVSVMNFVKVEECETNE